MSTRIGNPISQITLDKTQKVYLFNQTTATTDTAAFVTMHTYPITQEMASFDYIEISANVGYDTTGSSSGNIAFFVDATQITTDGTNGFFDLPDTGAISSTISQILIKGVHYTNSTAFNLYIKGKCSANGTCKVFRGIVRCWNG